LKKLYNSYNSARVRISVEKETKISFITQRFIECKGSSPELNWSIELKLRATATTPGQGIYRKGNRRSDAIRNNKFIGFKNSPELNWSIE
jgi:hypothetical protein